MARTYFFVQKKSLKKLYQKKKGRGRPTVNFVSQICKEPRIRRY